MRPTVYRVSILLLASALFAASPFEGTWQENVAKSKYGGPDKPLKEGKAIIEEQSGRLVVTARATSADGSPTGYKYSVPLTGGPLEYSEGAPPTGRSDALAKRKADSSSLDLIISRDGKVTAKHHIVVSGDGKSMRQTVKGTDAQGKSYETVIVWDRM